MAKYQYIRISLAEREALPILEKSDYEYEILTREECLKKAFESQFNFQHNGENFGFAYIGNEGSFIIGRIGRQKNELETKGPETGFLETSEAKWHAVNFILNTSPSPEEGQTVAFEFDIAVGTPLSIINSLLSELNSKTKTNWEMRAKPFTEQKSFWDVAKEHKGRITELKFNFLAPNILGGHDETNKLLRSMRDKINMRELDVAIKNSDGNIDVNDKSVQEGLEIVEQGGGGVKLKSGKTTIYTTDDEKSIKTEVISSNDNLPLVDENKPGWRSLIDKLFSVFER